MRQIATLFIQKVLDRCETEWLHKTLESESVSLRVKQLRQSLLETWTDTIERPHPDHPIGWHHRNHIDADDPYADLPLPPLTEG